MLLTCRPSDRHLAMHASMVVWAGIQTRLDRKCWNWPSTTSAISFQILALVLAAIAATIDPAAAVLSSAMQSVTIRGGKGTSFKTSSRAQASAVAAVLTHDGGVAQAWPTRVPSVRAMTRPHPVVASSHWSGYLLDPSMYLTKSSSSMLCGFAIHLQPWVSV